MVVRALLGALLAIPFAIPVAAQRPAPPGPVAEVVAAERAFADAVSRRGTRAGFLEYLAEDAVLFLPNPVSGRDAIGETWNRYPDPPPGLLSWEPAFAEVSRAGDLGYSTGPFAFRPADASAGTSLDGQYFTVWRRDENGPWRAVLDQGVRHGPPQGAPEPLTWRTGDAASDTVLRAGDLGAVRTALLETDRALAARAATAGLAAAWAAHAAGDTRVLRPNAFPAVGPQAGRVLLDAQRRGSLSMEPLAAHVARSEDLGYTFGSVALRPTDTDSTLAGYYVRVWRRETGVWRVAADVTTPLRPAPPGRE